MKIDICTDDGQKLITLDLEGGLRVSEIYEIIEEHLPVVKRVYISLPPLEKISTEGSA